MSCGEHHDVDCGEILQRVYVFIDNELEDASTDEIRQHLEECAPCLDEYDLDGDGDRTEMLGRCGGVTCPP